MRGTMSVVRQAAVPKTPRLKSPHLWTRRGAPPNELRCTIPPAWIPCEIPFTSEDGVIARGARTDGGPAPGGADMLGGGDRPRLVPASPSGPWLPTAAVTLPIASAPFTDTLPVGLLGANPTGAAVRGCPGRWLMVFLRFTGIPPPIIASDAGDTPRIGYLMATMAGDGCPQCCGCPSAGVAAGVPTCICCEDVRTLVPQPSPATRGAEAARVGCAP